MEAADLTAQSTLPWTRSNTENWSSWLATYNTQQKVTGEVEAASWHC